MVPITHVLYLAFALFSVGLAGAVLRRSLVAALVGVQLMIVAGALVFAGYARQQLDPGGQMAALLVVLVGLLELVVIVAVALRTLGAETGPGSSIHDWPSGGEPGADAGVGQGRR